MVTAVELAPDTCVLVRASLHAGDVRVSAIEILDPHAFPSGDGFASALKQARMANRLPRRARVVLWGVPDGAGPRDPNVQPRIAPLRAAGFRVERVVSPCNALAALARLRTPRPDAAIAWLAIDRGGVAIVVARPGEQLYTHAFAWDSSIGARGSQARMLQRYSLVAFLAPELRRAIAGARAKGARVDAIITCGNLPDLRSLTMPLIEEMDIEVETLDSLDGLVVAPALRDRATDLAPAIRLACAGVAARVSRPLVPSARRRTGAAGVFRAAAIVAAVLGVAWLWYSQRQPVQPGGQRGASRTTATPPSTSPRQGAPAPAPQERAAPPTAAPSRDAASRAAAPPPAQPSGAAPTAPAVNQTPGANAARPTAPPARPASPSAASRPPAPVPVPPGEVTRGASAPTERPQTAREGGAPGAAGIPTLAPPIFLAPARPVEGRTRAARTARPPQPQDKAQLLDEPLPRISTILVSEDRRFVMVDGRVLGVGDAIGRRVITAIEPRAIVLREPSGVQIRVKLGGTQ